MQKCEKRKITENISSSKEKEKKKTGSKKIQIFTNIETEHPECRG